MSDGEVVVPKVWRSEFKSLAVFFVSSILSITLSWKFPSMVVTGPLFSTETRVLELSFPVFWLIPFVVLCFTIIRVYDVRYMVDGRGIEMREGILSFSQRITRIRFEDIRSIETEQTILERLLDIGDVEMGTAATGDIEVIFRGVSAPGEIRLMVERERNRRQEVAATPLYQDA